MDIEEIIVANIILIITEILHPSEYNFVKTENINRFIWSHAIN